MVLVHRNELVQQVKSALGEPTICFPQVARRTVGGGPLATYGADVTTSEVELVPSTTKRNKIKSLALKKAFASK